LRLLLIGTPGTGKRAIGAYMEQVAGFVHLDFENEATREQFLGSTTTALRAWVGELTAAGRGLVITWGAGPVTQLGQIRRLRSLGIEPVWFDSDRGAAGPAHFADAARPTRFRFVDSFEPDGRFRPVEDVVAELLEPLPSRRLVRVPSTSLSSARIAASRIGADLRFRVAGGLAVMAGAAAATAFVLTGVGGVGQPVRVAAAGHTAHALSATHVPALPRQGILVSGRSLAGVHLGDTMATVKKLWGGHFTRCGGCKPAMWFYLYPPPSDPVGAGVQFSAGRVVAVFTLGGPLGWHSESGIHVGQILNNPFDAGPSDKSRWLSCAGYSAKSTRTAHNAVTSILTQGSAVYGFALTRPSISPCV